MCSVLILTPKYFLEMKQHAHAFGEPVEVIPFMGSPAGMSQIVSYFAIFYFSMTRYCPDTCVLFRFAIDLEFCIE